MDRFTVPKPDCNFCKTEMEKVWEGFTPENNIFIAWICPKCFSTHKQGVKGDSFYDFHSLVDNAYIEYWNKKNPEKAVPI